MHLHNARQGSHVCELLHSREEAAVATTVAEGLQLIKDEALQVGVHVADARHPHVGHKSRCYLILHGAYAPDELKLLHGESTVEMAIPSL